MAEQRSMPWMAMILMAGLVLRLQGLDWDQGRGFQPDEGNLVRAALALSWTSPIPTFHAYNDLSLWLPRLISSAVCNPADGHCLTLAARLLSALFSAAAVWLVALVAHGLAAQLRTRRSAVVMERTIVVGKAHVEIIATFVAPMIEGRLPPLASFDPVVHLSRFGRHAASRCGQATGDSNMALLRDG